ncbi:WYL domain-containing protein [Clostridium nigeriense]|uniref:WYL domain-containing protein n=1 Tax=Clostridium nigeriense TaxID=1805470 RepID=UPI003D32B337
MATLLIDKSLKDSLPNFCEEKNIKPYGNNKYIVEFPFIENDFNYNMLMRFGDKCECLGPQSIRDELVNRFRKLLSLYEVNNT